MLRESSSSELTFKFSGDNDPNRYLLDGFSDKISLISKGPIKSFSNLSINISLDEDIIP